jgi:hypothetical protein
VVDSEVLDLTLIGQGDGDNQREDQDGQDREHDEAEELIGQDFINH